MQVKNAGVAGYAEAFLPAQSDSQASEWCSYFENDVLVKGFMIIPGLFEPPVRTLRAAIPENESHIFR